MELILKMISAISQGLIWGVMVLGLYITFRILDFADLTVDGSLALGGSVSAILILNGVNPFLSLLISTLAGGFAGIITGFLHVNLKIPSILSGILTMTALYSINIRVMGKANTPLLEKETVFSSFHKLLSKFHFSQNLSMIILSLIICVIIIAVLYWFFGTQLGYTIRATGDNKKMICAMGINVGIIQILALSLSNGLVSFSGALIAQSQGYADINMGVGTIVCGLASIIIGENFIKYDMNFMIKLFFIVFGSILYRLIITISLQIGINPSDLKLLTSVIVALSLTLSKIFKKNIKKGEC